ncbi:winged helix-turn-helix transcriptional regulator [Cohnella lupini]|uniref:Two-component system alkaline phosphatase synthesis response regulator PhoP n=1 Tax=Cohnella lupini TaxID=1294267 RepID=A0A3D9IT72_9BACL|nr:winged-helix domain-containing protein [Cohnella lupini]RED64993.1 two-component system alkaline phosphatase synthesis response regulator PhoP [Cohnella lupini]
MPISDEIHSLSNTAVLPEISITQPLAFDDGGYCEITNRILIVSPRPSALRSLVAELAEKCYDVLLLHHADDPLLSMVQGNIVVVDRTVDFPAAVTAAWSQDGSAPVLALVNDAPSASGHSEEWVKWPGPIGEVIAKIQQLSLQYTAPAEDARNYVFKEIVLDPDRMTVTRGGSRVELTKTEYDLLRTIIAADGKVLTRQELLNSVWGEHYFGGSNAVDVHIRSLRSKLDDDPKEPRYIATVRGAGYRLADR